jgi:HK97 family phage prohead protease
MKKIPSLENPLMVLLDQPTPSLQNHVSGVSAIMPVIRSGSSPDPTAEEEPVLEFVASTARVDRYGEIIQPEGWRLQAFRRNPVFLECHRSYELQNTLGRVLEVDVKRIEMAGVEGETLALCIRVAFATTINPRAKLAYELYAHGFLNAVSVGFLPLRWDYIKTEEGNLKRYLEQELLEVSAVGIPANPDALILRASPAFARSLRPTRVAAR